MDTMFRPVDRLDQLRGAEIVCPNPMGSGESTAAWAFTLSGRKRSRGTRRSAPI